MKKLFAAALVFLSLQCQAGVTYQWQSVNSAAPYNMGLILAFTDEAVAKGSFNLNIDPYGLSMMSAQQAGNSTGLVDLYFWIEGVYLAPSIRFQPEVQPLRPFDVLKLNLTFGEDLSGSIYASNGESLVGLQGSEGLFHVVQANSDMGMEAAGCPLWQNCSGAAGRLQRVSEVPEPGTLAIFGAGLLGLVARRRR